MPPESPVPGWSIGDVCTAITATRGRSTLTTSVNPAGRPFLPAPGVSPAPLEADDRLHLALHPVAAEHGLARVPAEPTQRGPVKHVQLPQNPHERRRRASPAPIGDLHRDAETGPEQRRADQ